jgi:hypothetical protein
MHAAGQQLARDLVCVSGALRFDCSKGMLPYSCWLGFERKELRDTSQAMHNVLATPARLYPAAEGKLTIDICYCQCLKKPHL